MKWILLESAEQLTPIKQQQGYSLVFKHSTRCYTSLMAKKRFESDWDNLPEDMSVYFLDLIQHRDISNQIAQLFQIHHESPQLLLIKDGECVLDLSHGEISVKEALAEITSPL